LRHDLLGASLFGSLKLLSGSVHEDGDEIGHAERVTLHHGFMAEPGSATLAPSRAAGPRLPQRAVNIALRIVEHPEAHPFEVGNAERQQAFDRAAAARIEDGPRPRPAPRLRGSPQ
jgi:hypothetical protein